VEFGVVDNGETELGIIDRTATPELETS